MLQSRILGLIYGRTLPAQSPSSDFALQNYNFYLDCANNLGEKWRKKKNCQKSGEKEEHRT